MLVILTILGKIKMILIIAPEMFAFLQYIFFNNFSYYGIHWQIYTDLEKLEVE